MMTPEQLRETADLLEQYNKTKKALAFCTSVELGSVGHKQHPSRNLSGEVRLQYEEYHLYSDQYKEAAHHTVTLSGAAVIAGLSSDLRRLSKALAARSVVLPEDPPFRTSA